MAVLNQFQQYSQVENAVTNNVLLMLSGLYEINPKYYEDFIRGITEDEKQYEVRPDFQQQKGNRGNGVIDGYIHIKASKIIIETKLSSLELINKLLKYTDSFDDNEYKLLLHLSSIRYSDTEISAINHKLSELKVIGKVNFQSITYQDLVDQLKDIANNYQHEFYLQRLSEHFERYCIEMGLTNRSNSILRVMACGQSYELNVKYQFYFDLAERGYSKFKYLGIYKWKTVSYIGELENVIEASYDDTNGLNIINSEFEVTNQQKERLVNAIIESIDEGWDVYSDHRFFLLKNFTKTDFRKTSPGGLFRVRFFNLEKYFKTMPSTTEEIAEKLKKETWE